jgi:hypothetical protein
VKASLKPHPGDFCHERVEDEHVDADPTDWSYRLGDGGRNSHRRLLCYDIMMSRDQQYSLFQTSRRFATSALRHQF